MLIIFLIVAFVSHGHIMTPNILEEHFECNGKRWVPLYLICPLLLLSGKKQC